MSAIFATLQTYSPSTLFSFSAALAAILLSIGIYALLNPSQPASASKVPKLVSEGYPVVGALRFFTARWDFFREARSHAATGNFSFKIGKHFVVGLSGDKGRQVFFESRDLGLREGYSVLFGQSPNSLKTDGVQEMESESAGPGGYFHRRITRMLKTENFGKSLPQLMLDVQVSLNQLAADTSGMTDPFQSIYRIVFQLTIRMVGCDDIAEDPELMEKTLGLYETIEKSATPTAVIFPWFPSPAIVKRTVAGGRFYMILKRIVEKRKRTGRRRDDPLQYLIDQGDSMTKIIEFIVGALFAGLLNSGINVGWVLTYLAKDPYWLSKAREEVKATAAKHSADKTAPLVEQLSQLPVEAWESEFPVLDMCLRDSIRLQLLGTAFRRNTSGKDIPTGVGNEVIPPGAFVTYHTDDIHLDPTVYKDPEKWDPARYLPDRAEDKKKPLSYLGWGAGRHPCLGMRFAKLEQNIIIAFFLAMFDYELTDEAGIPLKETPPVDFNGHSAMKPNSPVYFKYTPRV